MYDVTGFRWLDAMRLIQSLGHNAVEAVGLAQRGTAEGTTFECTCISQV